MTRPEYGWGEYGDQRAVAVMVPGDEAVKELKGRVAMGQHMIDYLPLQGKGSFLNPQST